MTFGLYLINRVRGLVYICLRIFNTIYYYFIFMLIFFMRDRDSFYMKFINDGKWIGKYYQIVSLVPFPLKVPLTRVPVGSDTGKYDVSFIEVILLCEFRDWFNDFSVVIFVKDFLLSSSYIPTIFYIGCYRWTFFFLILSLSLRLYVSLTFLTVRSFVSLFF